MSYPTKKLGEVIDMNFGERITRTNNSGNKYPVYGGGGESFRTDRFNRENEYVVSRFAIAENCVRLVQGKFWLMDSGGTFSIKNESAGKLDKKFVGNVLLMKQKEIYNCARGGAQKNIDVDFFKKIKIPLPPLATQKQIVERLDKIAEAQKLNDELIQKTDELFQSLLHKELNPAGPADASTFVKTSVDKKAMAGKKDWEVKKLREVCEINPSKVEINKLSGSTIVSFLAMANVSESAEIINKQERKLDKVKNGFTFFKNGDVLVAKITPCFENGKGAFVENMTNKVGFGSTEFHVLRANQDVLLNKLLYYLVSDKKFRKIGAKFMTGSAGQRRVPKQYLENHKITLPPLEIQKKIVAKLSAVQDYKKQLLEQKAKLKELFDSSLAKSMK